MKNNDHPMSRYYVFVPSIELAKYRFQRIWGVTDFRSLQLERPNVYSVLKTARRS